MCRPKAKVRTKGESTYLHRYVLLPLDAPRNFSDTYFIHMLFPLIFGLEPSYIYHSIQHIFFSMVVALSREVKNCAYTYFYLWRAVQRDEKWNVFSLQRKKKCNRMNRETLHTVK